MYTAFLAGNMEVIRLVFWKKITLLKKHMQKKFVILNQKYKSLWLNLVTLTTLTVTLINLRSYHKYRWSKRPKLVGNYDEIIKCFKFILVNLTMNQSFQLFVSLNSWLPIVLVILTNCLFDLFHLDHFNKKEKELVKLAKWISQNKPVTASQKEKK